MTAASHVRTGFSGGVQWVRACGAASRGIVFAPPLIGGHALQQIRTLRLLVPRGFDVLSFSYAGHGDSAGVFSFQAALDNCIWMLDWARRRSRSEGVPLYGIASCFGALPMVHAAAQRNEPLRRVALINAVPHWRWERPVLNFFTRWTRGGRSWLSAAGLRIAAERYLQDLFPRVNHRHRSFGILSRRKMRWVRMAAELWALRRASPMPLTRTPVLCAYGRRDRLLQEMGFVDWSGYETHILDLCPRARFWRLDSDHFLSCPDVRQRLLTAVAGFFRGCPAAGRPGREMRHFQAVADC